MALSTTEAKYIAFTEAVKEALWIEGFIGELSGKERKMTFHCDSQNALFLMKNLVFNFMIEQNTDINLYFIRDVISSGKIETVKVQYEENLADALTEPLSFAKF